jgi:hypothetical protein
MFTQAEPIRVDAVVSTVLLHAHTPWKHSVLTGILPHPPPVSCRLMLPCYPGADADAFHLFLLASRSDEQMRAKFCEIADLRSLIAA